MSDQCTRELILVRHGQTDWNIARRYQGQTETDLNSRGCEQMALVSKHLADQPIDHFIASPLKRAVQSAEFIAKPHQKPIIEETQVMELHLGSWQGQNYGLQRQHPNWFYTAPHGGEDGHSFCDRIGRWLQKTDYDHTSLLVTHGLVIQVILMLISGKEFEYWHSQPIKNGGITRLVQNGDEWEIVSFNNNFHLKKNGDL